MKFKLFGRQILIGKDISQYAGRSDDYYAIMQQRYGTDYRVRNRLEAYKNIVYDCVSLIGEACGDYEPMVQRKKGDQWEKIDHEFIDLLKHPTGDDAAESFSMFDLFEATVSYQLLQGDCFWYMARGKTTGRPREIVVLRPDKVGTDIDKKTGEINGYFVRQATGDPIPLEIEEVLRFNLFNPKDPYKGYSPVEANSDYIETDESTSKFTKNFFNNNAGLSGVLNIKGEVTKSAFKKFVRAWRQKYEGVDNAGKVAVLRDSDAEFTAVGLGLDKLDMEALRKMSIKDVLRAFKVPLPLLGEAEQTGLGRANVEALEYIFAKYNIDKKMGRFDAVLEFALRRYYPEDKNLRIVHKNIIPSDKDFELNERDKAVDRWLTRDEIRDEEGLDSKPGGDQLFVSAMNMPIDDSGEVPPTSTSSGLKVKIIRKATLSKETSEVKNSTLEKAERFRLTLMRNQLRYERQYKKTVKPIFKEQRKEALYNLEAHASSLTKAASLKLFDDAAYDAKLLEKLSPMLTNLVQTQGGLALVFAGDDENEFHLTSNILAKLKRGTLRMATNFNDETLDRLNKTLAEGIQIGEALGDLKKRVNDVYDNIDSTRSERIARTETLKASNGATLDAYRQTGYVSAKAWVVNPDACPQCEEFDGKTLPLDDPFLEVGQSYTVGDGDDAVTYTNDYDTVESPPLHPNCRCTVIPIRESKALAGTISKEVHDKVLAARAEDKIYIKTLESHLGLEDEQTREN